MAKIFSSELHRNDNASLTFGAAIVGAVRNVRPLIAILANSRKADEYAPGAIHALRKLCEGEGQSDSIYRQEVEEWKTCFFKWFKRVRRWFADEHADGFLANAEDDFRVILECSNEMPEYFWRSDVDERHLSVTFENEQALDAARKAAEEKHPVELGSALHKYIEKCIAALVEEPGEKPPTVTQGENAPAPDLLEPRFMMHDEGRLSLRFDRFDAFDAPEELEQDIVTTGYDVEDAVRNYVNAHCTDGAADLEFDCESSMFCVYSAHPARLRSTASYRSSLRDDTIKRFTLAAMNTSNTSKPVVWLLVFICLLLASQLAVTVFAHWDTLLGHRPQGPEEGNYAAEVIQELNELQEAEIRELMSKPRVAEPFEVMLGERTFDTSIPITEEHPTLSEQKRQQAGALAERLEQWSSLDEEERREMSAKVLRFWMSLVAKEAATSELSDKEAEAMAALLKLFALGDNEEVHDNR